MPVLTPVLAQACIVVSDMAASIAFYQTLGLELVVGGPQAVHSEFAGPVIISLELESMILSFDSEWTPPSGGIAMLLKFDCRTPALLDDLAVRLDEAGYEFFRRPFDAIWGQRYAVVVDPDGNHINLVAAL